MGLTTEQIGVKMRLTGQAKYSGEMDSASESNTAFGDSAAKAGSQAKGAAVGIDAMSSSSKKGIGTMEKMKKVGKNLTSVGKNLSTYVTLPIIGIAAVSGKMALDFDRDMRNVNSIAQLPEKAFEGIKRSVLGMAERTAQAPATLAEGLYDIVSSGFKAKEGLQVLEASAYSASAGMTDTATAVKANAAAINAYHLQASEATKVSDTMFETVNRGVITYSELAEGIGNVIPFAAAAGISLNEVGAGISTLTKEGIPGATAMTDYKNTISAFDKPSKALTESIKETGFASAETLIKHKGLQGALEAVIGTTNGTNSAVSELFPNIRATAAAFGLTGKNAQTAKSDIHAFNNTAGATKKVLREQEKSFGFQLQRAVAGLKVSMIQIGEVILPIVIPFFQKLVGYVKQGAEWFSKLSPKMQQVVLGFALFLAIMGPLLVIIGAMVPGIIALATAIAFLWSPVTLIVLAVAAIAAGLIYAYEKVEWFHNAINAIASFIKSHWKILAPIFLAPFFPLIAIIVLVVTHLTWFKNAFNNVVNFFQALPGRIMSGIRALPSLIGGLVARMVVFWATLPVRILALQVKFVQFVVSTTLSAGPKLLSAGITILGKLLSGIEKGWEAVHSWFMGLPGKMLSWIESLAGKFVSIGGKIASEMWKGFKENLPGPLKEGLNLGEEAIGGAVGVGEEILGALASGTMATPRTGMYLVGEQGPELVHLPRAARVDSATKTRRELGPTRHRDYRRRELPLDRARSRSEGRSKVRTPIQIPVTLNIGKRKFGQAMAEAYVEDEANE